IAPRHPERFADAAALLRDSGLTWVRRTDAAGDLDQRCEAILLDSIGELRAVYPSAGIVFLGGSIVRKGGHNMIEPGAAGASVIVGGHTTNFSAIAKAFAESGGLIQLPDLPLEDAAQVLGAAFNELISNEEKRKSIAGRALAVCEQNRGATNRTIEMLSAI